MSQRCVLITGTSTGLGLETAVYLAQGGFHVHASMRDLARRADLDAEAARRSVTLDVIQLDVTDAASVARATASVVDRCGGLFGLVCNAGVGLRGYFEDLCEAEIRGVFEANVFGTMAVVRSVLPHMRAAGRGRVIVISSVGGRLASFGVSAYCASKFAQEGFSEALAQEVAPFGIGVSLVEPGIVRTERWGKNRALGAGALNPRSPYRAWFEAGERLADRLVATAPARPEDVASTVCAALEARQPRLRYVVGWRPGLVLFLRRVIPDALFERVYFGTAIRRVTGRVGWPAAAN